MGGGDSKQYNYSTEVQEEQIRPECKGEEHAYQKRFKCDQTNCSTIICRKCMGKYGSSGQRYCLLCALNIQINEEPDEWEDLGEYGENNGKVTSTFEATFSVKADKETGQIIGWDQFFQYVENSSQIHQVKEELTTKLEKKMQATFIIKEIVDIHYYIYNTQTKQTHDVRLIKNDADRTAEFFGLPNQLNAFLFNFTEKDVYEDTIDIINVLITMYDSKGDGQANLIDKMPTENEFGNQLNEFTQLATEDPSKHYDIIGKLGQGGFAKVFKVKRKLDGMVCALKFVEPKNDNERNIIINEIGVMRMCEQNQGILKVLEAYDFKNRLWIFVELMDDALTSYIQTLHTSYTENIVKYVLKKTLEGLEFLHSKYIIHRDVKSDNLLMSARGEVKLADFGYACQLTEERAGRKSKVGTVCWMAPELIRGERSYTTKVDIWSFGIFAMEMADGDPPYISEPQGRVIFNIVKKEAPPINSRWSSLYRDFVKLCLTKDATTRPDATQLLKHPFLEDADEHQEEFAESIKQYLVYKKTNAV